MRGALHWPTAAFFGALVLVGAVVMRAEGDRRREVHRDARARCAWTRGIVEVLVRESAASHSRVRSEVRIGELQFRVSRFERTRHGGYSGDVGAGTALETGRHVEVCHLDGELIVIRDAPSDAPR